MFEILIALFGGAYYGNKLLNEHIDYKEANKRRTEVKARRDKWCSMVTDRVLEEELRLFISRPENRDAVLEQVSEVYDQILDGRRIDEFYPRWMWCKKKKDWSYEFHEEVQKIVCKLDSTNALRIMMAKQGKFPSLDAITGSAKQFSPNTKLEAQVLMWCADELKRHGVKEEFYVPNVLIGFGEGGEYMGWMIKKSGRVNALIFLSFEQIASKNAYKGTPLQLPHNERDFLTEKAQFSFLDISEN